MGGFEDKVSDSAWGYEDEYSEEDESDFESAEPVGDLGSKDELLADVLDEAIHGGVDWENDHKAECFMDKHSAALRARGGTRDTLVHKIVERDGHFEKLKPLLGLLLMRHPDILEKKDEDGLTALYKAIHKKQRDMVKFMCDKTPDSARALGVGSKSENCLHLAIKKDADLAEYLIERCSEDMFEDPDLELKNTPLHVAVDYRLCTENQVRIVEKLLERCDRAIGIHNRKGFTPYRYHLETKPKKWSNKKGPDEAVAERKSVKRTVKPDGANDAGGKLGDRNTARHGTKKHQPKANKGMLETKKEKISNQILRVLKLHCMRYRDREATIDILYGLYPSTSAAPIAQIEGSIDPVLANRYLARNFEFDLNGANPHYTDICLQNMTFLQFEDILQYVALPNLWVEKTTATEPRPMSTRMPGMKPMSDGTGRKDLQLVFTWLSSKKVERIIKVIVEDNVQDDHAIPHSDQAIEDSLRDFDVEVWDWRKTDISIDTIQAAAKNVREVYLYSSGNNAVLRGWSDKGGLEILEKGLETRARTQRNVDAFKERLKKSGKNIVVESTIKSGTNDVRQVSEGDMGTEEPKPNRWLECMDQFTVQIVQNYKPSQEPEPIRVALIDDGIDGADQILYGNIADGVSFCQRGEGLSNTYYVASGGHGTLMATFIRRICPWIKLYVARLDEGYGPNGERQITADSAAKAINWAIKQNVHIISMSWTVQQTGDNQASIKKLENAIGQAVEADILLFCSANDLGNQKDKPYPASCDSRRIFRIGAATLTGDKWKRVGDEDADFVFPGEKILVQPQHYPLAQKCKTLSGSSIATAIAAGLAALILYMVEVDNHRNLRAMTNYERMKAAFSAPGTAGRIPYILVWDLFKTKVQMGDEVVEDEKRIFEWVVKQLVTNREDAKELVPRRLQVAG
ncbi:hypothetical protein FGG08_000485 [Glutinoglossum americanum]|uniref:Peptidase S8/S53 domain-containing protein n=1 Tax=Glutinoglossum americanum TaxID=1670608 RepID=A0A9P8I952_9PEZI|nr:hypothetical protein FGG08_000485 [Glutinoglossum americanum]